MFLIQLVYYLDSYICLNRSKDELSTIVKEKESINKDNKNSDIELERLKKVLLDKEKEVEALTVELTK